MPAAGPSNTRAQQKKRVVKKVKVKPALNAQSYVSQGKAVQKVANQQRKSAKIRKSITAIHGDKPQTNADRAANKPSVDKAVLQSRIKYLRRTRKPVTTLKRELEGKGLLAAAGRNIAKNAGYTSTGADSTGALGVGRKLSSGSFHPRGSAAILASGKTVPLKDAKIFGRAAQDLVNFPAQAVPSLYVPAAAAVEAVQGHPQRGKQFIKDIKRTDPIYNAGAAVVEKVKGNDKAAAAHLKAAGKSVSDHPGFAALEVAGLKGTVGRGVGRVVKAPERAPATVQGTTLVEKRTYSPDVIKRQRQKATDKFKAQRATNLRVKAVNAKPADAQALLRKANRVDPTVMSSKQIRRRVDERVAANEDVRRINRAQVTKAVDTQVGKKGGVALSLIAQNITKASREDLRAYRDELATHFDSLDRAGKRANKELRRRIDKVISDPKVDLVDVQAAAGRYEKLTAPIQAKLSDRGLLAAGQADKAKLIPYAVRHMGATHDPVKGLVVTKRVVRVVPKKDEPVSAGRVTLAQKANGEAPPVPQGHVRLYRGEGIHKHSGGDWPDAPAGSGPTQGRWFTEDHSRAAGYAKTKLTGYVRYVDVPKAVADAARIADKGRSTFVLPDEWASRAGEHTPGGIDAALSKQAQIDAAPAKIARLRNRKAAAKAKLEGRPAPTPKPLPATTTRVVTEESVPLRPQVIRAHMRSNNVKEPAFITQAPNQRGAKNYFVASDRAPVIRNARRTGEATRKGTFDAHAQTLREHAAKAQGLADATDGFTGFIKEVGHRTNGEVSTFANRDLAQKAADNMQADEHGNPTGATKMRPVRLNPWGAKDAQLHRLLDEVNADSPTAAKAVADAISTAVEKNAGGDGPWGLIPDASADQLMQHMKALGPGGAGKVGQLVNSSFRKTVLSTSPKWLLGNVTEAAGRSVLAKAGPRSYLTGKRVISRLHEIDPELAKEASVRTTGGGHYSMAERQPRRDHTQFEDTAVEGMAKNLGAFWQAPGPRHVAGFWHGYTDFVFNRLNRPLESRFQTAMLGKAVRDSNLMDGQTLKLSKTAIDQAARGLKNTDEQVAMGRAVDRMYGKYNKFGPTGRKYIALYTPFIAWTLNAYRLVYDVLPRDHPTVTALTVATERATEEWRKQHGLDLFIDAAVPGFIQGSVPGKGGTHWPVSRYLPFGAFSAPTETLGGSVLPQLSGVLAAMQRGEDWKGSKLKMGGKPIGGDPLKRSAYAAQVFAEATIPALALTRRLIKDGPSTLNPVRPIQPKKVKAAASSGGSSGVKWSDQGTGVKWSDQGSGASKWGG